MWEKFKSYIIILLLLWSGWSYYQLNKCWENPVIVDRPVRIEEVHPAPVPDIIIPPAKKDTNKIIPVRTKKNNLYHKVRKGENLYRLSLKYGTTVARLKELNQLFSDEIKKGSHLYIGTEQERAVDSTLYTYSEYFGNDTLNATVHTQSYGPILNQSVDLYSKPIIKYRGGLSAGLEISTNPIAPINLLLSYRNKAGYHIIGSTNFNYYSVGVMKDIRF